MFSGFSKETGEFLWELAFNNERPWFQAHKETFERVLNEPFKALAHDAYEELSALVPEEDFSVHVSRIYRDARRLFGRGPYKDHLWFTVTPAGAADYGPAFWFQIGASDYSYGLGFWAPTSAYMEAFRRAVAANPAAFERLVKEIAPMKGFPCTARSFAAPRAISARSSTPGITANILTSVPSATTMRCSFPPSFPAASRRTGPDSCRCAASWSGRCRA